MNGRRAHFHAVLLAGGSGTRFWPWSRAGRPKQFLPLAGGDEPLLVATWRRTLGLVAKDLIWVAAPRSLARDVLRMLPELDRGRLIVEPSPRDTAPAITLACATVQAKDPRAVVGFFPTDHVIRDARAFRGSVRAAVRAAERGALVCLGIRPDRPATGFGYLKCARRPSRIEAVDVERFVEKPDAPSARRFVRSGRYLWNGGMFVWRASRFLEEAERAAPGIVAAVRAHLAGRRGAWAKAEKRSIDYAVMEKAAGVKVVPLDAGWDDVGSWDAAARLREDCGAPSGDTILLASPRSAVFGSGRLVAIVDVPGIVVVDTPDAVLVVSRGSSEKVRRVVEDLRAGGRKGLL
ncbi:MAG: NTP transferase domain-containing protein [Acidobacteriia bacterium]|nr:NTP transferase domain-containing protein [Terriglobia bacterium]